MAINSKRNKPTQNERIIEYIKYYGSITQFEAFKDLGVMRLAARISDLRSSGYPIVSKVEKVENRFGKVCRIVRYSLRGEDNG